MLCSVRRNAAPYIDASDAGSQRYKTDQPSNIRFSQRTCPLMSVCQIVLFDADQLNRREQIPTLPTDNYIPRDAPCVSTNSPPSSSRHLPKRSLSRSVSMPPRSNHNICSWLCLSRKTAAPSRCCSAGVNTAKLERDLKAAIERLPRQQGGDGNISIGRDLNGLLNLTDKEATKRGDQFIASELFLLALADDKSETGRIFKDAGATSKTLEAAITAMRGDSGVDSQEAEGQRQSLEKYCIDLTARARSGKLDPVIGRDDEIRRVVQVLQRRTKNNPVLIGEPGRQDGHRRRPAQRIVNGEVPEGLKNKRVLSLDFAALLAGARSIAASSRNG